MIIALALVVFITIALTYGVRGCNQRATHRRSGSTYVPPGDTGTPAFSGSAIGGVGRATEETFLNIPVIMTERLYEDTFDGVITSRLSPDGSTYVVTGAYQRGARKYLGFRAYSVQGELLWEHVFPNAGLRSISAWFLAGGQYVGAMATDYNNDGEIRLFDLRGRVVLTRPVRGWTVAVASDDGSWLALIDERNRSIQVLGPPRLEPLWSMGVEKGATARFIGDGPRLLLSESGRARLFDEKGQAIWTLSIPGEGRWNALCSPDGQFLAATTEDPDSSVYLYDAADGSLLWSQFLVVGGDKRLAFSPDGAFLVIYDVGQRAAVYIMNVATGEIPWRFTLAGREDATLTMNDLQFTPNGQHVLVDVVESTVTKDAYLYYHYLLLMTPDGRALWVSPLGAQVDVEFHAGAKVAVIATNNPINFSGDVSNSVTLVSFTLPAAATPPGGP